MAGNKITASNTFEGGLVADLHVMASPDNTVIDALNMEIITIADKQFIFQNIRGNKHIVDLPSYTENNATYKFIPLGVKVSNNIAYILAGAFDDSGNFLAGTIGTFPSPNWTELNDPDIGSSTLINTFSPLHNYKELGVSEEYDQPFISKFFNFEKNRHIDIEIQGDFDNSVNIIYTDSFGSPSIINSRFKRTNSASIVELADREGNNDSNIYSDEDWDRIALIQNTNYPVKIEDPEILPGGYLRGGGYRYYFKYITQEGNTTEILYESPLIPIANGGLGLNKDQISDKMVRFPISGLDNSYSGIQVYFAHFDGEDTAAMEVFKINYVFSYGGDTSIVITHTGLEDVTLVDSEEINVTFSPIDTAKSIAIINDRLAIAGASSTIKGEDLSVLRNAALKVKLWERHTLIDKDYSDPKTAATKLGYWKGEVYEFAVVFLLTNKGLSPAFPVTGMDNIEGTQEEENWTEYPEYTLDDDGFSTGTSAEKALMINSKGIFRTANKGDIFLPRCDGPDRRNVTYIEADTSSFYNDTKLNDLVSGFFVVRRPRVKNVLLQGMMVPTLKVPSKEPALAEYYTKADYATWDAHKKYLLKHFQAPGDYTTIGLNAPYTAGQHDGKAMFNDDFDTAFVPQPTQLLNILTFEKSWSISGSIGQDIHSTEFGNTVDKFGNDQDKMHVAFYSCELELNYSTIKGHLNGINPGVEVQGLLNDSSPLGHTYTGKEYSSTPNTIVTIAEKVSLDRSPFLTLEAENIKAFLIDSGVEIYTDQAFTSRVDRSLGLLSNNSGSDYAIDPDDPEGTRIYYALPFWQYENRSIDPNIIFPTARHGGKTGIEFDDSTNYLVYSLISQTYSRYIGFEIDTKDKIGPRFNFHRYPSSVASNYPNGDDAIFCPEDTTESTLVNTGHLTNVFRSSTGRWMTEDIKNIFKYDSNKAYNSITKRYPISEDNTPVNSVDIFSGDGFISKIYKRVTYKNGVPESLSATTQDARTYGIGITEKRGKTATILENLPEYELKDDGRNLFDVGQVIEIVSYSNVNADIRSVERVSSEDSALNSGDRDFYPNKQKPFGDRRPDSTGYNHGYTGASNPVSYHRIEENAPIFNTEFPNRILLSERNKTQSFFNSFRDLKGFNYRDYGVELGPIISIVAIKNILLSIHPDGVLAVGIDDRTLIAEGSDVFVNTAESLSPKASTISDVFGSQHAESIVRTDTTVAGVDYASSAVWLFEGDKLSVISEFAIKTILNEFKSTIEAGGLKPGDTDITYLPRVYSTFNHSKHTLYIAYVAENPNNKNQIHVGSVTYNTVLNKWSSRLSEGNKFEMSIGSIEYTTGFSSVEGLYGPYSIWQEDALVDDTTGKGIRTKMRGIDYEHQFEIVINKEPSLEKILDNIRMICNKSLPVNIIYTTSGDINDAAINVWGPMKDTMILDQAIVTRNSSSRNSLRLGILDENAYYKNSNLYIEAGKVNSVSRGERGNRRIRDKHIKVRFKYTGNDETFIQGIISILSISHS